MCCWEPVGQLGRGWRHPFLGHGWKYTVEQNQSSHQILGCNFFARCDCTDRSNSHLARSGDPFWGLDGSPQPGGIDNAHNGWVKGVCVAGNRLISWGLDGAIRFWGLDGSSLPGCIDHAHDGPIKGVCVAGNWLISWGSDWGGYANAIRIWRLDGSFVRTLAVPGFISRVGFHYDLASNRLYCFGRALWIYELNDDFSNHVNQCF